MAGTKIARRAASMFALVLVLFLSAFWLENFAFADTQDETNRALLQRIAALEQKVEELNKKLEVGATIEAAKISDEFVEKKVQLKDIGLSGFVDTSYTYNFAGPDSRSNTARVFDTEANNFNVQAAELVFEKLPPDEGGVGFRTDLFFGQDAEVITPTGSTRDQFDSEQAYISFKPPLNFNLPIGNWQWIRVGKFVTMHGAEVIESKDNWNFSRSILFGYAIPFTHTGLRVGYDLFDGFSGYVGVNNGWDNVKDNNNAKSVEASLSWVPLENVSLYVNT